MEITDILRTNRQQVLQIASRQGASHIRVLGSIVRGESQHDSDIDLLVDMEPGRSLLDMGGLVVELRELLGRSVDVVTERWAEEPHS